MCNNQVYLRLA